MTSVLIVLLAFAATTIQLVRSNLAKEGEPHIGGLHRTAAVIVLLSTVGLALGVTKELQAAKGARNNAQNLKDMDTLVKATAAKLDGISARLPVGDVKEEVQNLRDRLSAPFSEARFSNLKVSDFEYSVLLREILATQVFRTQCSMQATSVMQCSENQFSMGQIFVASI